MDHSCSEYPAVRITEGLLCFIEIKYNRKLILKSCIRSEAYRVKSNSDAVGGASCSRIALVYRTGREELQLFSSNFIGNFNVQKNNLRMS